jgi:hypothetical protein
MQPESEWIVIAEQIFERLGTIFFDFDIVRPAGERAWLLEVNCSPAPVYYESEALSSPHTFSSRILMDWMTA